MNNNIKYIGLLIVIILFGIFSLPKIYERVVNSDIKDSNRLNTNQRLSYLTIIRTFCGVRQVLLLIIHPFGIIIFTPLFNLDSIDL